MAAVAAGSLVLFSVLAQRAALTPSPGGAIVPHVAPPVDERRVINVPEPARKIAVPPALNNAFPAEAAATSPASSSPPKSEDNSTSPNTTLVASLDVNLNTGGGDGSRVPAPRPRIRFGRNLNPPDRDADDDSDGDDDGSDHPTAPGGTCDDSHDDPGDENQTVDEQPAAAAPGQAEAEPSDEDGGAIGQAPADESVVESDQVSAEEVPVTVEDQVDSVDTDVDQESLEVVEEPGEVEAEAENEPVS